jgi:drug/metabolite transporter (DMT)-like permease
MNDRNPNLPAVSDPHAKGLVLTAVGGLMLTVDIPLIRLADGDPWSILLLRSSTTFVAAILIWLAWRRFGRDAPPLIAGWPGIVVATLYGLCSVTFILAVHNTSTANLVFILVFNSMFAALLSWLFLNERPRAATLAAMGAMLVGILIIVGDGIGSGSLFGDAMALVSTFLLAAAITYTRRTGLDMGFASLIGVVVPFVIAAAMVARTGYDVAEPVWIVLNGAIVMPVAFYLLATGPRYLTAPEVAMFYLLETVLAPVWIWMVFAEVPSRASLMGGAILVGALVLHSLWQLHQGRRRRATPALRHPA